MNLKGEMFCDFITLSHTQLCFQNNNKSNTLALRHFTCNLAFDLKGSNLSCSINVESLPEILLILAIHSIIHHGAAYIQSAKDLRTKSQMNICASNHCQEEENCKG